MINMYLGIIFVPGDLINMIYVGTSDKYVTGI